MSFTQIGVWVGGKPVEFAVPFNIIQGRGTTPSSFQFLTSKPSDFNSISNPVEVKVVAPNSANSFPQAQFLKNWYVTAITPWEGGNFMVTVEDSRWYANRLTFTGSFNIQMPDLTWRIDSLQGQQREWRALDAIKEVLKAFGLKPVVDRSLQGKLSQKLLPRNQGNSEAGGWFGAKLDEVLPSMLESIRCDIFQNDDGDMEITDRVTDYTGTMGQVGPVEGHIANPVIKFQKPKFIDVLFEQRVERILEFNEDPQASAVRTENHDQYLENVVQDFILSDRADAFNADGTEKTWFTNLSDYCTKYLGFDGQEFRKRYMRDTIIPDGTFSTDIAMLNARVQAEMARQHWRKVWLVKHTDQARGETRPYADMILGRLGPDGNNNRTSYVFLDYMTKFAWSWYDVNRAGGTPLSLGEHKFSRNFPFPSDFTITTQAPYDADWMSDGKTGLVFQLKERRLPPKLVEIHPGLLDKEISYGEVTDIIRDADTLAYESNAEMTKKFKMRVYYHGLLAMESKKTPRIYKVRIAAFSNGEIDKIEARTEGITANWGYEDKTGDFPGVLLNLKALEERAKFVASQIKELLEDAKSGIAVFAGIDPIAQGYETRGNIHQRTIMVTTDTITTQYDVIPGLRPLGAAVNPLELDGRAPNRIG